MTNKDIFLSVGGSANNEQERFIQTVENRLRAEGLNPQTVGRNTFSVDTPLKTIEELMDRCVGTVVLALERTYFPEGTEKRGGDNEAQLEETTLPTPWNHIEAAMAYSRRHPLLVIVEKGLRPEGLLEANNDWYVQSVSLDESYLNSPQFNGILASWKSKLDEAPQSRSSVRATVDPSKMTVGQLIGALKISHFVAVVGVSLTALATAFALGARLISFAPEPIITAEAIKNADNAVSSNEEAPVRFTARLKTRANDHASRAGTDGNVAITFYSTAGDRTIVFSGAGRPLNQGSSDEMVLTMPSSHPIRHISVKLEDNGTDQVGWLGESLALINSEEVRYCWTWLDRREDYLAPDGGMETGLLTPNDNISGCN